jgi:hypothetical protein
VQASPKTDIASLLARHDIEQTLGTVLHALEGDASEAVQAAWRAAGNPAASPYREALLGDVARAYAAAPGEIAAVVAAAFASVPAPEPFAAGITPPGHNPAMAAARQRSAAVRHAVIDYSASLALRNRLSVTSAGARATSEAVMAEAEQRRSAGEDVELEWIASMDGKDPRSCIWCRKLHGTRVVPGAQFPHPEPAGKRKPPRLYLGHLFGPPLHGRCRCKLAVVAVKVSVSGPPPAALAETPGADFISSETIRDMPEAEYGKLHHFLTSSLHELSQLLSRLLRGS